MRTLTAVLLSLSLPHFSAAQDWPCWRGPDRTGVSAEKNLLTKWPDEGPKLLWSATGLGEGYSTPSVAAGKLYVMGSKDGDEYVHCVDVENGKNLWSKKVGKVGQNEGPSYPGPRATPAVVGDVLYALGSDGDLVCSKCADGKQVWHRHLEKEYEGVRGNWAYTESPLVDGDLLVCTPGGAKAAVLALERKTGKEVWKTPMEDANGAGYASMVPAKVGERKVYVQFFGAAVVGIDAKTGEQLFRYRKNVGAVSAMTPIVHDGHVFTSAAGRGNAGGDALLKLNATKKGVEAKEVYLSRNMLNFHGGVVRVGDHLYGTGGVGLVCLEFATGGLKWSSRGVGQGSLMAADGHLYVRGTTGAVALVEATATGYREKGRLKQPRRSGFPTFSHPVVAGGRLYLRDADLLFCYDLKSEGR